MNHGGMHNMEAWSDEYITLDASRLAASAWRIEYLRKCAEKPFVRSRTQHVIFDGPVTRMSEGNPETELLIDRMVSLAEHGYLTYTTEPTGMSRTYSPKAYTFTLTEKGRRFLEEADAIVTVESKAESDAVVLAVGDPVEIRGTRNANPVEFNDNDVFIDRGVMLKTTWVYGGVIAEINENAKEGYHYRIGKWNWYRKDQLRHLYGKDQLRHFKSDSPIAHCPSEAESFEHLAGEEVARDPEKGAHPLCPICWHHHPPTLAENGCGHLD